MGVAVGDWNNDGFPDVFVTCVGQNRLFRNTGTGRVRGRDALERPRRPTSVQHVGDLGRHRSRRTPRPVRLQLREVVGRARRLLQPRRPARSRTARPKRTAARRAGCSATTATARSRTSRPRAACSIRARSRSASWPSTSTGTAGRTCSSRTTRSRTSCIAISGTARSGRARSRRAWPSIADGKARAGMGVDAGDLDGSGRPTLADHQLRQRDDRAVPPRRRRRSTRTPRRRRASAGRRAARSASVACSRTSNLDGALDLIVANGHIDDTVRNIRGNVGYAQPPHLFMNQGDGTFRGHGGRRRDATSRVLWSAAVWRAAISIATATSTCS